MSYLAEISRNNPTCLLFVIDQSTSMNHRIEGGQTKAAFLADVLNRTIYTLITTCTKADGVRDYFHVGVIAYSGTSAGEGFQGPLRNQIIHPISVVADSPLRIENRQKRVRGLQDDVVEQTIKFPVWIEPRSRGRTSMNAGLRLAADTLLEWCGRHARSYPPTVLHVTDGHPTDGDPERSAQRLRTIGTEDGHALLLNLHLDFGNAPPSLFPNDERGLPDRYARTLYRLSSELPAHLVAAARSRGYDVRAGAHGFVYNAATPELIVDFFDIGTRPATMSDR